MKSVHQILRQMFKVGYTMRDLSTDKMFAKRNHLEYNKKNKGGANETEGK
jgi:hypothetical protein